jgi:predicted signal transduction protein with EAL and GGDEF domain
MSDSLRIATVAEGIETAEQAARMRALGCTFGQGYFFARPLDAAELLAGIGVPAPAALPETAPRRQAIRAGATFGGPAADPSPA